MQHLPAQSCPERQKRSPHYRRSCAIRRSLSVPLLCGLGSTALGEEDLRDGVSAPVSGSQALRPLVLCVFFVAASGPPALLPSSAARGPMERLKAPSFDGFIAFPWGCNGLKVDEAAACGMPVAVIMPWERHPSFQSKKHSHVCDVHHSIPRVTRVASLRLSGSGTAATEHCLARVRPRQCLLPPAPDSPYHQRPRPIPGKGFRRATDVRACFGRFQRTCRRGQRRWRDAPNGMKRKRSRHHGYHAELRGRQKSSIGLSGQLTIDPRGDKRNTCCARPVRVGRS